MIHLKGERVLLRLVEDKERVAPLIHFTDQPSGAQMTGWVLYGELEGLSEARAFGGTTGGGRPLVINVPSFAVSAFEIASSGNHKSR